MIPMQGMVQSLNISVACAVSIYEAMRQRLNQGMYKESRLPETDYQIMLKEWKEKNYTK